MRVRLLAGVFIFLAAALFLLPGSASADEDPILNGALVPTCDAADQAGAFGEGNIFTGACQLCDLVKLADNLIRFAVAFSVIVATLMFAYAGFLYFTASASEGNIKKAHGIFSKVFGGLVIILVAWLVVDIIMRTLVNQEGGNLWHEIECAEYPVTTEGYFARTDAAIGDRTVSDPVVSEGRSAAGQCSGGTPVLRSNNQMEGACPGCTALRLPTSPSASAATGCYKADSGPYCYVKPTMNTRAQALSTALGSLRRDNVPAPQILTVTGAVGGQHCATCQIAGESDVGTCIDARTPSEEPRAVREFIDAARSSLLRAQLEFTSEGQKSSFLTRARAAGISFTNDEILVVGRASAVHYSIYSQ
jgi:hypothetical protein